MSAKIIVLVLWFLIGIGFYIAGAIEEEEYKLSGGAAIMSAYVFIPLLNMMS